METTKTASEKDSGTTAENTPVIPAPAQLPQPDTTGIDTNADKTHEEALPQKLNSKP